MIFNLNNDKDRADYKEYCNGLYMDALKSGKGFIVEVKKKHRPRSLAQNSYLHVCLQYFASEFGYDEEYVKYNIFKQIVNREIFAKQRTNRRGEPVTYWRSTADLDTKELTDAIEKFRNYSSMFAPLIEILLCLQAVTQDFMGELIIPYLLPFLVQICIIEILES